MISFQSNSILTRHHKGNPYDLKLSAAINLLGMLYVITVKKKERDSRLEAIDLDTEAYRLPVDHISSIGLY